MNASSSCKKESLTLERTFQLKRKKERVMERIKITKRETMAPSERTRINIERRVDQMEREPNNPDLRPRTVVIIERALNRTPEKEVSERLRELGPDYRVVSAQTSLALQG